MTDTKLFPLCREMGLTVESARRDGYALKTDDFVRAADVERLLSEGVRAFRRHPSNYDWYTESTAAFACRGLDQNAEEGLLINIKPIEKPVRKRELSESEIRAAFLDNFGINVTGSQLIDRAIERLFGGKETNKCEHKNFRISEPHLAGARVCNDCGAYKSCASEPFGPGGKDKGGE